MRQLLQCGSNLTQKQQQSCKRLNKLIVAEKYPYRFDNAVYIAEASYMNLSCFMGHSVQLRPYELKNPYTAVSIRHRLPKCKQCIEENITDVELKYRQNIFYYSGCQIEVLSRYVDINTEIEHRILDNGYRFSIKPRELKKILKYYRGRDISEYIHRLKKDRK